jgi:hypothetical protein
MTNELLDVSQTPADLTNFSRRTREEGSAT